MRCCDRGLRLALAHPGPLDSGIGLFPVSTVPHTPPSPRGLPFDAPASTSRISSYIHPASPSRSIAAARPAAPILFRRQSSR